MTHKKLLAEIIAQSKENTVQLNAELKEQIQQQTDKANCTLLESFSQSYQSALKDFSKESTKLQEQQQQKMLDFVEKFITVAAKNQKDYIQTLNDAIVQLSNEQNKKIESIKTNVAEIHKALKEHNEHLNETWSNIQKQNNETQAFIINSILEMKNILNQISEKHCTLSDNIQNALKEENDTLEALKKQEEQASIVNYKLFKKFSQESSEKIAEIKSSLDTFTENQATANTNLNKKIARTLEDSVENMTQQLDETFQKHQEEILHIDSQIQENTKAYQDQLCLVTKAIQDNNELSSKDIDLLDRMMKVK